MGMETNVLSGWNGNYDKFGRTVGLWTFSNNGLLLIKRFYSDDYKLIFEINYNITIDEYRSRELLIHKEEKYYNFGN